MTWSKQRKLFFQNAPRARGGLTRERSKCSMIEDEIEWEREREIKRKTLGECASTMFVSKRERERKRESVCV